MEGFSSMFRPQGYCVSPDGMGYWHLNVQDRLAHPPPPRMERWKGLHPTLQI